MKSQLELYSRAILSAAFPHRPNLMLPGEVVDGETFAKRLKKNKVPLLSLTAEGIARIPGLAVDPGFLKAQAEAQRLFQHVRTEFTLVRDLLEAEGIPRVALKAVGPFPYESDNLDLLVPFGLRARLEELLRPLGYVPVRHYREDWKYIFKRFENGKLQYILHAHEQVSWGVEPFLDISEFWKRSIPSPEEELISIPSAEDSFLTVTAHGLYENDAIKLGDLWKVHQVLRRGAFDWDYARGVAARRGWVSGYERILILLHQLETRFWGESLIPESRLPRDRRLWPSLGVLARAEQAVEFPAPLGRLSTKGLFARKILANPQNRPLGHGAKFKGMFRDNGRALLHLSYQKPLLITLSGMDGCGKSTVIKHLHNVLQLLELKQDHIWLRAGNSDFMQAANKLGKKVFRSFIRKSVSNVEVGDRPGQGAKELRITNPRLAMLWFNTTFSELALQVLVRVRLPLLRGRVVVCDRYLVDSIADLMIRCGQSELAGRYRNSPLFHLFPKPDLALHLVVSPEESLRRKDDGFTRTQLQARHDLYQSLARHFELVDINTEEGLEQVLTRVTDLVTARYAFPGE